MSSSLAKLLNQPERLVTRAVAKLEKLNGSPNEDVRLLAENSQAVRRKLLDLALDPDDTTGEELYQALLAKFSKDGQLLDRALGVEPGATADRRLSQAVKLIAALAQTDDIWVLKTNAAKKILHDQPPKKLMRQLSYRSVDSLLKRENIAEVYLALPFFESASWLRTFAKSVSQLPSTNYEMRAPEAVIVQNKFLPETKIQSPISNNLIGAIAITPTSVRQNVPVLTLSLMFLDGLEALTHSRAAGTVATINPALLWWEQAKTLVANCGGEPVSLNYKDISIDHLKQSAFKERTANAAQTSLWEELSSRYQKQTEQLQESLASAENITATAVRQSLPKNLAVEYAEAIANEF